MGTFELNLGVYRSGWILKGWFILFLFLFSFVFRVYVVRWILSECAPCLRYPERDMPWVYYYHYYYLLDFLFYRNFSLQMSYIR